MISHIRYERPILKGINFRADDFNDCLIHHAGEQWANSGYSFENHIVNHWQLKYCAEGFTEWIISGKNYTCAAGNLIAIPPGQERSLVSVQGDLHLYYVSFKVGSFCQRFPKYSKLWKRSNLLTCNQAESICLPLVQLMNELYVFQNGFAEGINLSCDLVILTATRLFLAKETNLSTNSYTIHPSIYRAKELIDSNPQFIWRTDELAKTCGLSPKHFSQLFKKEIGAPPHQYLMQVRINRACQDLKKSNVPITSLAYDLGFSSVQHFCSSFKAITGITPTQYRKNRIK